MASILGGELVRRLGGRADALRQYVGGLPEKPMPPFHYQLVFFGRGPDQRVRRTCAHFAQGKAAHD
jgi:hypothetical protein